MKKFIYLCGMMLLSLNMMAQIDLNDKNWRDSLVENFSTPNRSWDTASFLSSDKLWRAYPGFGVTGNSSDQFQVYQYSNCHFNDTDGTMELVAEYDKYALIPRNLYHLPKWMWPEYGGHGYPSSDNLFYFSGCIDYVNYDVQTHEIEKFLYGYFEIRCKMPIDSGAHTAFWLHSADTNPLDPYYEEIDIFEFSWSYGDPGNHYHPIPNPNPTYAGDPRVYSTAVLHNLHGNGVNFFTDIYTMDYPQIPPEQEDIGGWHTYSCEWMPDHVYWYRDGILTSSYYDQAHIPRHPLTLKTSYAINQYAVKKIFDNNHVFIGYEPSWMGDDTLTIDYIKVYQLGWDCDTDEVIACQNDLTGFDYIVKKSIAITSTFEEVVVEDDDKITFRVADSFEITGPFQAESGCEFAVIRQDCPE